VVAVPPLEEEPLGGGGGLFFRAMMLTLFRCVYDVITSY